MRAHVNLFCKTLVGGGGGEKRPLCVMQGNQRVTVLTADSAPYSSHSWHAEQATAERVWNQFCCSCGLLGSRNNKAIKADGHQTIISIPTTFGFLTKKSFIVHASNLHWLILLLNCSFSYSRLYWVDLLLSICDIMDSQKSIVSTILGILCNK